MFYATHDWNGSYITENAKIIAFETREAAEAYLLEPFQYADELPKVFPGRFSDCWFKTMRHPRDDQAEPFVLDDLIIQAPGNHPGGNAYWITPSAEILVAE